MDYNTGKEILEQLKRITILLQIICDNVDSDLE